jgi:hypothetical protein
MALVDERSGIENPDAGVIDDARARQRRHRMVGLVAVAAAGAIAVGGVALWGGGGGSGHVRGSGAGGQGPGVAKTPVSSVLLAAVRSLPLKGLRLLPSLEVGAPGWDVSVPGPDPSTGFGAPTVGMPIFAGGGGSGDGQVLLAAPEVAAIRVPNGPTVRTERAAALPFGLRAAVYRQTDIGAGSVAPVALNAAGHAIASGSAGIVDSPTLRWETPGDNWLRALSLKSGNHYWVGPVLPAPPRGACSIEGGRGLQPVAGEVVTAVVANPGILGRGFVACVDAGFLVGGVQTRATVLLDARDPGTMPGSLSGTTPLRGHRGIVAGKSAAPADGPLFYAALSDDGIVARRVGDAWLVVQSTGSLTQRITVLRRLRIGPIETRTQPVPAGGPSGEQYAIVQRPLAGLREAAQIAPFAPRCFTLCTIATFFIGHWTLQAHVWLASIVGHGLAPARLHAVPGVAATYVADAGPPDRLDSVWHRIGKVWLIVDDGRSVQQDITVSKTLTVRPGSG